MSFIDRNYKVHRSVVDHHNPVHHKEYNIKHVFLNQHSISFFFCQDDYFHHYHMFPEFQATWLNHKKSFLQASTNEVVFRISVLLCNCCTYIQIRIASGWQGTTYIRISSATLAQYLHENPIQSSSPMCFFTASQPPGPHAILPRRSQVS